MFRTEYASNRILNTLPAAERLRFFACLEQVRLELGAVIHEPDAPQSHVYFPLNCMISLLCVLRNGSRAEIAIIGDDGMVGMPVITGDGRSPQLAIVQAAGYSLRMKAQDVRREFDQSGCVRHMLLRYSQALVTQVSQSAVCNRHHNLEEQLCRWLLICSDRVPASDLAMTQEMIAAMLGVRREGVTEAAGRLRRIGAIGYARGRISVLDRSMLEALTCECYEAVRVEYARLLPGEPMSARGLPTH